MSSKRVASFTTASSKRHKATHTPSTEPVFTVIRTTKYCRKQRELDVKVKGTYHTLKEANKAVSKNLLDEWDRDCFEEYTSTKDKKMLKHVNATLEDDEGYRVFNVFIRVNETPVKPQKYKLKAPSSIFHVMQVLDPESAPTLHSTHLTLKSAKSTILASYKEIFNQVPGRKTLDNRLERSSHSIRNSNPTSQNGKLGATLCGEESTFWRR